MTRYLRERALFGPLIATPPPENLGVVVVIPAKDEDDLPGALGCLRTCELPPCAVEVIVVVNTGETDDAGTVARNQRIAEDARKWAQSASEPPLGFHILEQHGMPRKHAGVGLARKIGMDEACRRLERVGNARGAIACFDADSRCDPNYLVEIERLFRRDPERHACSIYFEHPTEGDAFPPAVYDAIVRYELHLRCFVNAQRLAGFPFATQTIGSSMAVRCDAYQAQNGMNRRKAGEDFYFLHKFTPLGHVAELNTTRVVPSPRVSHRVPFGTGKAVGDLVERGCPLRTYAPESFEDLRVFFASIDTLFEASPSSGHSFPKSVESFLETQALAFEARIAEIRAGVASAARFRNRFFRWFNAFTLMKFLHHARDRFHPDADVAGAARRLLGEMGASPNSTIASEHTLLQHFRDIDRSRHQIR